MRRLLRAAVVAVLVGGGVVSVPGAAVAATTCSRSWHFITHGETGLNVRPDPLMYQGNTTLYADGVPGDDTWNQQFMFCRDPGWGTDHYAIYSNLTGRYWSYGTNGVLYAGAEGIHGTQQLFQVWKYDSTWWVIRAVGFPFYARYAHPNPTRGWSNQMEAVAGPLNGTMLFRITPSDLMS
ncbi:hypothetical protein [Paractinoplanes rishiriensis]|uniref:hypothetical protein n=1 Tax=Paractinoplanes rishiriensis TaxID=1050105 RepID=UPI001944390E|nr:hypothetical protein [Actinoplanes rishiriensis]